MKRFARHSISDIIVSNLFHDIHFVSEKFSDPESQKMSRDLLAFFESRGLKVTEKDYAYINNMLVVPSHWPHKTSFIGMLRKELQKAADYSQPDWTTAEQEDELLHEQVVQPQFLVDAACILLDSFTKRVQDNKLDNSWVCNCLLALIRTLCKLTRKEMHVMGTKNAVITSRYEKDGAVHYEIAVLQVIVRRPSSLQNIWRKKRPSVIDLSAYYKKIIE